MNRRPRSISCGTAALAIVAATLGLSSWASATVLHSFVASTGNDSNTTTNCGLAAPCRTFNGADAMKFASGKIVALDAADYGQLTITHALTIVGEHQPIIAGNGLLVDGSGTGCPSGHTGSECTTTSSYGDPSSDGNSGP